MGIRGELFTNQVNLDNRSYFFNVKENRNGDVFLQIVESKIKDGEDDRRAIVVFSEDMQDFLDGLDTSLRFIDKDKKEKAKIRAAKKAERDTRFGSRSHSDYDDDRRYSDSRYAGKKIYRRKGESRLVADRRSERQDDGIKRTGRVIHITSKRPVTTPPAEQSPAETSSSDEY